MTVFPLPTDYLLSFPFEEHNAEIQEMWSAFRAGNPLRTPIILGLNARYFLLNPSLNQRQVTFRRYSENPHVMFDLQLEFQRWSKFNLVQDTELGLPEKWKVWVDLQNYYDATWLGCELEYPDDEVPDVRPAFSDCPEKLMERGLPDPFGGTMADGLRYWERFKERAEKEVFFGRPIEVAEPSFGTGMDGVFTVACCLIGPETVCEMLLCDTERIHQIFGFIAEALVAKVKAWRQKCDLPYPVDGFSTGNDCLALISARTYREHILPYDRLIYDTFATEKNRTLHLCGDAGHLFQTLNTELGITTFDTGFPVDFAALRRTLGPEVTIQGGPHIEMLRSSSMEEVATETRRILESGVLEGGRFVLREGNNLAPLTPPENVAAMYGAGRRFGFCRDGYHRWNPVDRKRLN
ncbi:MAG: hypothetical protein IT209_09315 [Armatimonadetes bacterium]|nr:hypothetical protein [Armatimonadota bacterium]